MIDEHLLFGYRKTTLHQRLIWLKTVRDFWKTMQRQKQKQKQNF